MPSGDQRTPLGEFSTRVICVVLPSASIHRTKIWLPSVSPSSINAMRVPSGDQIGEDPSTKNRLLDPSAFMIQMDDRRRSFILSTQLRVKSIWLPSGDTCGFATHSQSR